MKKIIIAFAAVSVALSSVPALAQSANDTMYLQRMNDPAYRAAVVSPQVHAAYGYGSSVNGYGYAEQMAGGPGQVTTCVLGLFCSSHPSHNHADDVCYDANGVMYALDDHHHWYRVEGAELVQMTPGSVYVQMQCGRNSYSAGK